MCTFAAGAIPPIHTHLVNIPRTDGASAEMGLHSLKLTAETWHITFSINVGFK